MFDFNELIKENLESMTLTLLQKAIRDGYVLLSKYISRFEYEVQKKS